MHASEARKIADNAEFYTDLVEAFVDIKAAAMRGERELTFNYTDCERGRKVMGGLAAEGYNPLWSFKKHDDGSCSFTAEWG